MRTVFTLTPPLATIRRYSLLGAMLVYDSSIVSCKPIGIARLGLEYDTTWLGMPHCHGNSIS